MQSWIQPTRIPWLIAAAIVCALPLCPAPAPEGTEILIARDFARKPVPQWTNGYLLGFELHPVYAPTVFAYNRQGNKLFERALALQGAQEVFVRSTAASGDGRFAYGGTVVASTGERSGFIAFLDGRGQSVQTLRLPKFYPQHLCITADGTLWVAGTPGSDRDRPEEDHDVLRAYSADGKMKFSLLARSSFAAESRDRLQSPHPAVDGRTLSALAANDKVIVFLSAAFQELITISLDGKAVSRVRTDLPSYDFITGLVVEPDGRALISCQTSSTSKDTHEGEFSFHRLDPVTGGWTKVYGRSTREKGLPKAIALSDGNQLLVKMEADRFRWISRLP